MNALPEQGQYILYSGLINSPTPEKISIASYLKEKGFDYLKHRFRNFEDYPPEIISDNIKNNFISLEFKRGDIIVNFKKTVTTPGIYSFTVDLNPYKGSSFGDKIVGKLFPDEYYYATFFICFMEINFSIAMNETSKNIRNIIQRKGDEKNGIYVLAHKNIDETVYLIATESPVSLRALPGTKKIDLSLSGSYPQNISITQTDFYGISTNLLNSVFCMFSGNTGGGGKYVFDLQADFQEKIGNVFHSNTFNEGFHFNVIGDIDIFPYNIPMVSVGREISMRLTTSGDARFNNLSVDGEHAKTLNLEIKNNILSGKAPEKPGQYSFTVSAKDELDNEGVREYILTVQPQLSLSPQKANLPRAILNKKYSVQFSLTDHVRKACFSLKGKYPKGLSISNNGLLSGVPKESGDWELIISVVVKEPDNTEFVLDKKYHLLVDSKYDHEVKNMGRWVTGNFKRYNIDVPFKLDPAMGVEVMTNNMPSWLQFSDDYKNLSGTPGLADWTGKEIFLILDFFPEGSGITVEETYSLYVSSNNISITPSSLSPGKIGSLYKEPLSTKQSIFEPTFILLNKEAKDIGLSVIVKDGRSFISGIIKRTKLIRVPVEIKVKSGYGDEGSIRYYLDLDRDIQLDIFPPKHIYVGEEAEIAIKINESSLELLPEDYSLNLISMGTIHAEPSLRLYKKSDGREWLLNATFHLSGVHKFGIEVKSGEKIMCVREVTLKVRSDLEIETVPKHLPLGNVNTPYGMVEIKCIGAASGEINYKEYGLPDDWHFQQKNNTAYIFGTPRKPSSISFIVAASDSTGAMAMSQQIIDISGPPVGVNRHINVQNGRSVILILTFSNTVVDLINRATSASFIMTDNDSSVNVTDAGKVIERNGVPIGKIIGPDNNGVIFSIFSFDKSQVHGHFSIHYVLSNRYGNSQPYLLDFSISL
ncbi:hypothetical protein [Enterobacter asburiae]|uniref:hypothetical protein n=1 Tax=Enterobacter asburiae TaxID=61645 RepID=UPI001E2C8EBB|nr:hypothetical protein [Enterobacter asburiae]MCE2004060.1 hypothetical protein [Enterobacter asburiae]